MRSRRALYLALGIPAALVSFLYLTLLFTPNDAIRGVVVRAAENAGYTVDFTGFGKRFPLGLKARTLELSSAKGPLVKLRDARLGLRLLPLLVGRVQLGYGGNIGAGELEGDITLGRVPGWSVQARGVRLEEIPFFTSVAAARVKGELRLTGALKSPKGVAEGDLKLEVRGAELAGIKIGEMPLPDASYKEVRGALRFEKGHALLKSFTLDGDGIYVRLKGDTTLATPPGNSPLNLTLEMMPKPAFLERQKFVFLLLTKYQSSPGAYSIPIRGTLAHPAI
jgi:type II secretion system protein N